MKPLLGLSGYILILLICTYCVYQPVSTMLGHKYSSFGNVHVHSMHKYLIRHYGTHVCCMQYNIMYFHVCTYVCTNITTVAHKMMEH